jgi:hypothetical protein
MEQILEDGNINQEEGHLQQVVFSLPTMIHFYSQQKLLLMALLQIQLIIVIGCLR